MSSRDQHPASRGLSRLFTASLVEEWHRLYGYSQVTPEQLLRGATTNYLFLRAIGLTDLNTRRLYTRVAVWVNFYEGKPLPTLDGKDYLTIFSEETAGGATLLNLIELEATRKASAA